MTESEYDATDKRRAKVADEHNWLEFEVRMRTLMKNVVAPVIEVTTEDREVLFDMEQRHEQAVDRLEKLEEAVFRTYHEKGRTIFHEYDDRLSDMKSTLVSGVSKLEERLAC
jgi:hypothetical protein